MDYRLYILDPDGKIRIAKEFIAENDDRAHEYAKVEARLHPVELWQGVRRIGSFGLVAGQE